MYSSLGAQYCSHRTSVFSPVKFTSEFACSVQQHIASACSFMEVIVVTLHELLLL